VSALAAASGVDEGDYRSALSEGGHEETLAGDILRRKAVELLLTLVAATDESGVPIELPPPQTDDDDGRREAHGAPDHDEGRAPTEVEE
jgi:hypothetical protein